MTTAEIRKAAVLLMSLPSEQATRILSRLEPRQVEAVSIEIVRTGAVTAEEQQAVILEFAKVDPQAITARKGGWDVAKTLVEKAFGKNSATLERVRQSLGASRFGFLNRINGQDLVRFLIGEHPQTIALVLTHLPASRSAMIIADLPLDLRLEVIRRIATMEETNPDVIQEVEQALARRTAHVTSQQFETAGGVSAVAEILNVTDRATERDVLERLAQDDPQLAEEIRQLMFAFEDLVQFPNKDIQVMLRNVGTAQWAIALKGASEDLKQKILGNMSQRASTMLKEEMEYLGPVRFSAVEQVQQQIVDIVRRLEDVGEIRMQSNDDIEQFIQ